MIKLTASEKRTDKVIQLKKSIINALAPHQDGIGYGHIFKAVTGWELNIFFTPHSNEPITFTATNDNGGSYNFELDATKLNQGWIVLNGINATASNLLSDWFSELIAN